jgi:hypothetical protein
MKMHWEETSAGSRLINDVSGTFKHKYRKRDAPFTALTLSTTERNENSLSLCARRLNQCRLFPGLQHLW